MQATCIRVRRRHATGKYEAELLMHLLQRASPRWLTKEAMGQTVMNTTRQNALTVFSDQLPAIYLVADVVVCMNSTIYII